MEAFYTLLLDGLYRGERREGSSLPAGARRGAPDALNQRDGTMGTASKSPSRPHRRLVHERIFQPNNLLFLPEKAEIGRNFLSFRRKILVNAS
jgi:hypothetical protein